MATAEQLIAHLKLQPHPREGGFFRETYRSVEVHPAAALPARYGGDRSCSTAIYYLLTPNAFSALHRLASDEVFHFYLGDPVQMLQLWPNGEGKVVTLGPNPLVGQEPQMVVPRNVWQGSRLVEGESFALLGCTVAPGFDYADYETGKREELIQHYPPYQELIRRLTLD
jgi:predicted cupin superfamily sugar epimerase